MKQKSLRDMNLLDRFLFAELAEDNEAVETILRIIIGDEINIREKTAAEKEKRSLPWNKQVRLDVWAVDDEGNVYDTEVQKQRKDDLRKRTRFYSCLLDFQLLKSGDLSYNNLKDAYVIMITPFDLFGEGKYKYVFEMTNETNPELKLNDGTKRIFLNTQGTNSEGASQELIDMLHYFEKTQKETIKGTKSDKLKFLQNKVEDIRSNEEIGVKAMNRWEERIEDREEGRTEGRKEGREERNFEIARKLKEMEMSVSDIVKATSLTEKEIKGL